MKANRSMCIEFINLIFAKNTCHVAVSHIYTVHTLTNTENIVTRIIIRIMHQAHTNEEIDAIRANHMRCITNPFRQGKRKEGRERMSEFFNTEQMSKKIICWK